jgi:hypothetical protein
VNDRQFDPDQFLHTISFGSIVERALSGVNKHPYHQHVYPFQIVVSGELLGLTDLELQ